MFFDLSLWTVIVNDILLSIIKVCPFMLPFGADIAIPEKDPVLIDVSFEFGSDFLITFFPIFPPFLWR